METGTAVFVIALVLLGKTSLVLQSVGFFATTWITYDMRVHADGKTVDISIDIGLWTTTACSLDECVSLSNEELRRRFEKIDQQEASKVAGLKFLDDFDTVKSLVTVGGLLCIIGKILNLVFIRCNTKKVIGFVSAFSWGAGSILVLAAVLLQSRTDRQLSNGVRIIDHNPEVSDKLKMEIHFPWASFVSGLGAGVGVFVASLMAGKSCTLKQEELPGTWNRFDSRAV